jgi:hypothetical protein
MASPFTLAAEIILLGVLRASTVSVSSLVREMRFLSESGRLSNPR